MTHALNILMVNWIWHRVAGEWTYIDNLSALYRRHGHRVIPFSMKHPENVDTGGFDQYFIENINYSALSKQKNPVNSIRAAARTIYSLEAKKNLSRLLEAHKIDAAHLHDVNHYLTPSILPLLRKHNIPIFWTLHDYILICPESTFFSNGRVCERCKDGAFYHCAVRKCKKGAFLPSVLAALENTFHAYTDAFRYVDYFLCPSRFLYNKFLEYNFFPDKLVLLNNCCEIGHMPEKDLSEQYIIYSGRLAKVKGIFTLLEAVKDIPVKLLIAGNGPEAGAIARYIAANRLTQVEMLGFKPREALHRLVQNALCLVCPSEWYENFPYAIIEAMLLKTPVIAAAIGGIPELVVHEETGLLFEPRDAAALKALILRLLSSKVLRQSLAEQAYARTQTMVNFRQHYKTLKEVYARAGLSL